MEILRVENLAKVYGKGADSGVYFLPNNVLRECFGIVKDRLYGNLKFF